MLMITQERALEIANEYFTRNGGVALRLMSIRYSESSPMKAVTQIRYTRNGSPRYIEIPLWEGPVWFISYFMPQDGSANSVDIFVNARTGELLENLSI